MAILGRAIPIPPHILHAGNQLPPGSQPGSGLVKRRTSARAFIQFKPVRTINGIQPLAVLPKLIAVYRRARSQISPALVGSGGIRSAGGIAVPPQLPVAYQGGLVIRRVPIGAFAGGLQVKGQQPNLLPRPPPTLVAVRPPTQRARAVARSVAGTPPALIQYRGTGTSGNSGSTNLTTQAITLPTGWAAGDILFVVLQISSSAVTGFSQTGGTGTWTIDFAAANSTANSFYAFAHRVMVAGDTAPTFSWTTASFVTWSSGGFFHILGRSLMLDKWAVSDPLVGGSASASAIPNAVTAAINGEASIILSCAKANVASTSTTHSYSPPPSWNWNDGNAGWSGTAASKARFSANAYQIGVSGTVTPTSESLTDDVGDTFFWNVAHALVREAPLLVVGGLIRRRTAARAVIQFTPVQTVNASSAATPSGSVQPQSTFPLPRRRTSRAFVGNSGAAGDGNAVPGLRSTPVTGSGLVRRRTVARGIWGGLIGPPRQIPVTGGLIGKSRTTRAIWHGNAVPGILPIPVTGGLVKRRTSSAGIIAKRLNGAGQPGVAAFVPKLLTNNFEGGTNGVTISTGNSGGASGNAFDVTSTGTGATTAFDNTQIAHGTLSANIATGSTSTTSYVSWSTSLGIQTQVWFRQYLYVTANPATSHRVLNMVSGGTACGGVLIHTSGKLQFVDSAGAQIFLTTATIPLGRWFRIEGFILGSATVGQVELKLFKTADSTTPDEIDTSAASQNTAGAPAICRFGITNAVANVGPFWMDDIGVSNTGYLGPAFTIASAQTALGAVYRRSASQASIRAVVQFTPVRTTNARQIPVTGGLIRRRTAARGFWAGNAVPGQRSAPVTGGLVKRRTSSAGIIAKRLNGAGQPGVAAFVPKLLTNTAEGGSNGVTASPANTGGASGASFDIVTIGANATLAFDSTISAHGLLAYKVATGASSVTVYAQWSASMGPQPQVWFRLYLYFTAFPPAIQTVWRALSGSTTCGGVQVHNTTGILQFTNAAGAAIFATTSAIPLNQWFRIEGYILGSATVGQAELKLFNTADSLVADETKTSAATQNTLGIPDTVRFGIGVSGANFGPFWMDDIGVSNTGYLGPAFTIASAQTALGAVYRRSASQASIRAVVQFTPVRTTNVTAATPSGSIQPQPTFRLPRRLSQRALTGNSGQPAGGNAVQGIRSAPVIGGLVTRRTASPAVVKFRPVRSHAPILINIFEGGTSGVAVSPANSGGASGTAFDLVSIASGATCAYDNTHAAHGGLSCQVATVASGTSYAQWAASAGSMPQAFFRIYLYFTANPGTQHRIFSCLSGGTVCASILVTTAGKIQVLNTAGSQITITTAAIPLNQWFRIEGYVIGSATVGQTELKLFKAADALTADETNTSAATQNTTGTADTYRFGVAFSVVNAGPYWQDDIGLSPSGYLGPVLSPPVTGGLVERRVSARAVIKFTPVQTVNASSAAAPSGSIQPQPTFRLPRRIPQRGFWAGNAVPGRRSTAITGGLIRRRSASRGIWGGIIGPPRQIPVTGGLVVHRRTPSRALWHGNAVPGTLPVPVTSGLIKRRSTARVFWAGVVVRTINAIPQFGPPGSQPGSGLVKRRTSARAFVAFTPVRTTNAFPAGSVQPRATVPVPRRAAARAVWAARAVPGILPKPVTGGGLVKRRTAARGVWGGGIAVPGRIGIPVTNGLLKRRTSARAVWLGTVVRTINAIPQFGPPGSQPGSGLVKRRTAARAFIQFTPVRTVNAIAPPIAITGGLVKRRTAARAVWLGIAGPGRLPVPVTGGLIRRRTASRAFIQFRPVRTTNIIPQNGTVPPHPIVARRTAARGFWAGNAVPGQRSAPITGGLVKRRTAARAVWAGNAVPGRRSSPVTGGLVRRRTAARGQNLHTIVRTVNALPVPGNQPGGVILQRNRRQISGAFIKFKPVILNISPIPYQVLILHLGSPRVRWQTADPVHHWQLGSPRNSA